MGSFFCFRSDFSISVRLSKNGRGVEDRGDAPDDARAALRATPSPSESLLLLLLLSSLPAADGCAPLLLPPARSIVAVSRGGGRPPRCLDVLFRRVMFFRFAIDLRTRNERAGINVRVGHIHTFMSVARDASRPQATQKMPTDPVRATVASGCLEEAQAEDRKRYRQKQGIRYIARAHLFTRSRAT